MSKIRLYEIAKNIGKESKEVVAKAKELGFSVTSHSSSVESDVAEKIKQAFSPASVAQAGLQNKEASQKDSVKPVVKEVAHRPKSRNFKAEREAKEREKAQNKRRSSGKHTQQSRGRDSYQKPWNQEKKFSKKEEEHKRAVFPKIDFKARAEALKAEQNREYARNSEERFRQTQLTKKEEKKRRENPEEIFQAAEVVVPIMPAQSAPAFTEAPALDTRRKKQAKLEKKREEQKEHPRKQMKHKNNQNQVRNQKSSNWNPNKKAKKAKQTLTKATPERKFHELPTEFEYTAGMTVAEIAKRIKREPAEIVKKLFMMGIMATQNQSLDAESIELLMVDYGIEAKEKVQVDQADIERFFVEESYLNPDQLRERPPVVTIMGHVDHGKTTLLDTLRNSRVVTDEAGGITQHIGAYQITENGKKITFLDTPGHAAFTSMRARGASVTDITILVVAADDGVMPQTIEAINHSKAADVPIVVAINKIDKPDANPERVIGELAEHGVISTAWGGDCEFVEISAKFHQNIDELLETVLLVAEIQELKADPTVRAIGTVIEARLDKGKGAVATLLVQQGTLKVQDPIVVGNTFGRVRAMTNDLGRRVKVAEPSTPVSITGLNETPMAGDRFAVYEDEKSARAAGEERAKRSLFKQRQAVQRVNLENLFDTLQAGQVKSVNVIIKADVQGSVEALTASLQKIDIESVKVTIVHAAVGAINESDITLAEASNAIIVGFNVRPTVQARQQAEADDVDIRLHSIIYKVIEEVEDAMKGLLDPEYQEKVVGEAQIRETFKVAKIGTIGGFMVTSGKVMRDSKVRVIRDGVVIYDGELSSLKHFKDDVKEVTNGREGGLMIEGYNDLLVDDVIEAYILEEIKH